MAGKILLTICCVDLVLIMQGRAQFYIVVYGFIFGTNEARVVDRFPIDLELSVSSGPIARTTYSGIHNVAEFDLSFRIDCSENYHGPQCDVFCMEVPGQFTCDSDGNIVCVNSILTPGSNCTQCRVSGKDPQNNCEEGIIIARTNALLTSEYLECCA